MESRDYHEAMYGEKRKEGKGRRKEGTEGGNEKEKFTSLTWIIGELRAFGDFF